MSQSSTCSNSPSGSNNNNIDTNVSSSHRNSISGSHHSTNNVSKCDNVMSTPTNTYITNGMEGTISTIESTDLPVAENVVIGSISDPLNKSESAHNLTTKSTPSISNSSNSSRCSNDYSTSLVSSNDNLRRYS